MDTFSHSKEMQELCPRVLLVLASEVEKTRAQIVKARGINVVIAAMRNLDSEHGVQETCCRLLANVGSDGEYAQLALAEAGGIEAAVAAMQMHISKKQIQTQAFRSLPLAMRQSRAGGLADAFVMS